MSSSFIQLQISSDVVSTVQSTNARASQRKGTRILQLNRMMPIHDPEPESGKPSRMSG